MPEFWRPWEQNAPSDETRDRSTIEVQSVEVLIVIEA